MPVILATWKIEIRRIMVRSQPVSENTQYKKGLVDWFKW
jgi:hypothetical protein